MKINMIVARDAISHGIGKDNKLLYRCKEDMEYFKKTTMGSVVVMGRKTFESIGKALPGRINIVLTHNSAYVAEGAHVLTTVDEVKMVIKELNKDVFIIGGLQIYKEFASITERLYLTEIYPAITVNKVYDTAFVYEDVFENGYTGFLTSSETVESSNNDIEYVKFTVQDRHGIDTLEHIMDKEPDLFNINTIRVANVLVDIEEEKFKNLSYIHNEINKHITGLSELYHNICDKNHIAKQKVKSIIDFMHVKCIELVDLYPNKTDSED